MNAFLQTNPRKLVALWRVPVFFKDAALTPIMDCFCENNPPVGPAVFLHPSLEKIEFCYGFNFVLNSGLFGEQGGGLVNRLAGLKHAEINRHQQAKPDRAEATK